MRKRTLTRRDFLRLSAVTAAGAVAAACAQPTPMVVEKEVVKEVEVEKPVVVEKEVVKEVEKPVVVEKEVVKEVPVEKVVEKKVEVEKVVEVERVSPRQAPMLQELVKAGELPPLEDRLPVEPLVLDPVEEIGQYCGPLRYWQTGTSPSNIILLNYDENFLKFNRDGTTGQRANLAKSWEWNEDATELVLHFRRGVKWSDGEPLTVNDWIWYWENMVLDENVGVPPPTGSHIGGERMTVEKIDDYTMKWSFVSPNPLSVPQITRGGTARGTCYQIVPAHFFKQFHYKFNTELKETEVDELLARFEERITYDDMPHLGPWIIKEVVEGEKAVLERNPYYWKVDPEGNQLPYMDGLDAHLAATKELIVMKVIAGEVDFWWGAEVEDYPVVKENEAQGGYTCREWSQAQTTATGIILHYCYDDEALCGYPDGLFWNRKFRMAMSHAMNRKRIQDTIYYGMGVVRNIAMSPVGMEFQSPRGQKVLEEWANLAIEYDPELAKTLLDEVGVVDKDGDGFREKPDGSELKLIIDADVLNTSTVESLELVADDFEKVGLKLVLNVVAGEILDTRSITCESMMNEHTNCCASGLVAAPAHWTPIEQTGYCICGSPYGLWFQTGGKEGIKPPEGSFIEKLQEVYADCMTIADEDERNDRVLDGYQIHIDDGPHQLGTVGDIKQLVVVKDNLHNVPPKGIVGTWTYGWPGAGDPEHWWTS